MATLQQDSGMENREAISELPARKADTCDVKEHRISRAHFNHVNKRPTFCVTLWGIQNSSFVSLSAAAALSGNLLIRVLT